MLEKKILKIIFSTQRNNESDDKIGPNIELSTLFNEPNIVRIFKSQKIKLAGHLLRVKSQIYGELLNGKHKS